MVNQASRKIAVVTGASSGIGAVYAQRLAARGDLWLVARRADRLRELASEIGGAHGVNVETVVADLTSEADLQRVEQRIAAEANIHVLVNNAGLARLRPVAQSSVADTATQIALNITALVRLTQAVVPGFVARNEGAIINIASVLALDTLPVSAVYSGTKGFVLNYTRGLQLELANTGVKVQRCCPQRRPRKSGTNRACRSTRWRQARSCAPKTWSMPRSKVSIRVKPSPCRRYTTRSCCTASKKRVKRYSAHRRTAPPRRYRA